MDYGCEFSVRLDLPFKVGDWAYVPGVGNVMIYSLDIYYEYPDPEPDIWYKWGYANQKGRLMTGSSNLQEMGVMLFATEEDYKMTLN